ncbi:hypothetical protein ACHAXR_000083 [Thalassiosira sp. AJA248-18]
MPRQLEASLRYNLAPLEMPQHCDGCSARMTVEHALSCKVGGQRCCDEFRHLCGTALFLDAWSASPEFSSANRQG